MKEKFNDRTCEKAFGGPTSVKGHLLNKSGEKPHVGFLTVTPLLFSIWTQPLQNNLKNAISSIIVMFKLF